MSHQRVKFITHEEGDEIPKGWHLLVPLNDGEYTLCGLATPEYETKEETKEKGGITCEDCLEAIRFIKSVKA